MKIKHLALAASCLVALPMTQAEAATARTSLSVRSWIGGASAPSLVQAAWTNGRSSWTLSASGNNGPLQVTTVTAALRVTKVRVKAGRSVGHVRWCASGEPYGAGANTHRTTIRWRYAREPWRVMPPISKSYRTENLVTSPDMKWTECFMGHLALAPRAGEIELELSESDRLESVMTRWEQTVTVSIG